MVGWLVGYLVGWLVGWLVGASRWFWSVDPAACSVSHAVPLVPLSSHLLSSPLLSSHPPSCTVGMHRGLAPSLLTSCVHLQLPSLPFPFLPFLFFLRRRGCSLTHSLTRSPPFPPPHPRHPRLRWRTRLFSSSPLLLFSSSPLPLTRYRFEAHQESTKESYLKPIKNPPKSPPLNGTCLASHGCTFCHCKVRVRVRVRVKAREGGAPLMYCIV